MSKEQTCQVANCLCIQKIQLHESFDRRATGSGREPHSFRDFALQIERKSVLGAPRDIVHMASDRPEEIFRLFKFAILFVGEQTYVDKV